MFEFFVYKTENRIKPNLVLPYFNESLHIKKTVKLKDLVLESFSYQNERDTAEDENTFIGIYGSIYHPIHAIDKGQIDAPYLLEHLELLKNPTKNLRGNYAILFYDKVNSKLSVINDPLGLKPVYYGTIGKIPYISSSLYFYKQFNLTINESGLLEKLIFDYNISNSTVFYGISSLDNGAILKLKNNTFEVKKYFSLFDFALRDDQRKFSLDELANIFNRVFLSRVWNQNQILISLTGGNDGRAVVSAASKFNIKFDTYSFGQKNGENTLIPEKIAQNLNFRHFSIYLHDQFENNYYQNALDTINLSDGNLIFEQQSTLYCFQHLPVSDYGNKVYTGLLAGEILGPIHLKHDYFNEDYFNIVYQNKNFDLDFFQKKSDFASLVEDKFIKKNYEKIYQSIKARRKFISTIKSSSKPHLYYYLDLIELGFRRFYGSQMHLIRYQAENIPVFYDLDILDYLLNTNFNFIFRNSFKSILYRWRGRFPQSYITLKNNPQLAALPLDRGYKPEQLLHPLKRYLIFLAYYRRKFITKKKHPDFDSPRWCKNLLNVNFKDNLKLSPFFNIDNFKQYIIELNQNENHYSLEKNKILSNYLFILD
ncbi:hypothetical protein ACSSV9_14165 [Melioribacter sp. OK-6-Me]|uniref:hypothetical protein n=1 Tax=Melioribacter sp. OK-6-Me TaxID=3423433 RepID=UPI003ED995B4